MYLCIKKFYRFVVGFKYFEEKIFVIILLLFKLNLLFVSRDRGKLNFCFKNEHIPHT
jgi:hypothetical protein